MRKLRPRKVYEVTWCVYQDKRVTAEEASRLSVVSWFFSGVRYKSRGGVRSSCMEEASLRTGALPFRSVSFLIATQRL